MRAIISFAVLAAFGGIFAFSAVPSAQAQSKPTGNHYFTFELVPRFAGDGSYRRMEDLVDFSITTNPPDSVTGGAGLYAGKGSYYVSLDRWLPAKRGTDDGKLTLKLTKYAIVDGKDEPTDKKMACAFAYTFDPASVRLAHGPGACTTVVKATKSGGGSIHYKIDMTDW